MGRERIAFGDDAQRKLAARWLGTLHTSAVDVVGPRDLPDRGASHYQRLLRTGRASVLAGIRNPALRPHQRHVVETVLRLLDAVEGEWSALEQYCRVLPRTLAHGDFRAKNVLVRAGRTGMRLHAIDWELAGWGLAAPDLAPSRAPVLEPQVDAATYVSVARERWPDSGPLTFEEQVTTGSILRMLAAVEWAAQSLRYPDLVKPVRQMEYYVPELLAALAKAPWRRSRHR